MDHLTDLWGNADFLVKGVLTVLIMASVGCWTIAFEKLIRIMAFSRQITRLEEANRSSRASQSWLVDELRAVAEEEQKVDGETQAEFHMRLERSLQSKANAELQRLQSGLSFLATVGSTAPFIGLFGTVWGIMRSFTSIAAAKDTSLAAVAPGIAEALFATAAGLAAAIPAVIFYNQANVALGSVAERLSAAVAQLAKRRVYGAPTVTFAPEGALQESKGLLNGGVDAR